MHKRDIATPLLKFLGNEEVAYVLLEVHERIDGQHLEARALAKKILRVGYFWPTMVRNSPEYVKK